MVKLQRQINDKLMCLLCNHLCQLKEGETGRCRVRKNTGEKISLVTYGRIVSMTVEPIEKKPITHFLPGTKTLSIGTGSCNMSCQFCENHDISQQVKKATKTYTHRDIIDLAKKHKCESVCMTFTEPTVSFEWLIGLARAVRANDLKFVLKTNSYICAEPWRAVCGVTDAMNIDLKGGIRTTAKIAGFFRLGNIVENILEAQKAGVHLEFSLPLHHLITEDDIVGIGKFLKAIHLDAPVHILKINATNKYEYTTSSERIQEAKNMLSKYVSNISVH